MDELYDQRGDFLGYLGFDEDGDPVCFDESDLEIEMQGDEDEAESDEEFVEVYDEDDVFLGYLADDGVSILPE